MDCVELHMDVNLEVLMTLKLIILLICIWIKVTHHLGKGAKFLVDGVVARIESGPATPFITPFAYLGRGLTTMEARYNVIHAWDRGTASLWNIFSGVWSFGFHLLIYLLWMLLILMLYFPQLLLCQTFWLNINVH